MKSHVRHVALGGVLAPVILAIAAAIANGAQEALHLDLHGTALAIFLVGFVAGAAAVTMTSVKAEAQKLLAGSGGLSGLLGELEGIFGGGAPVPAKTQPAHAIADVLSAPEPPPPPPAPPEPVP